MNYVIRYKYVNEYRYLSYFRIMIDDTPDYLFTSSILDAIFYTTKESAQKIVKEMNLQHKITYGFSPVAKFMILSV